MSGTEVRFCFLLGDSQGQSFMRSDVSFVFLPIKALVGDFQRAVKVENSNKLSFVDASDLLVYTDKAAYQAGADHLKPLSRLAKAYQGGINDELTDANLDEKQVLYVLVPSLAPVSSEPSFFSPCSYSFYSNIAGADEKEGWLEFKEEMPFSGLTRLYIRQSYQDIASTILACSKRTKSLITGTPGIGKSVFLLYLLWKLVKSGKRVLIIDDSDKVYYDGNGGIFELEALPPSTRRSFWSDDLWCLFDAKNKTLADLNLVPYKRGSSVLSTSPRRDLVNDFKKPSKPQVYFKFIMPLWSHLELKEIAPKFEKSFGWEYRFKVLGGIPRFVLEDTDVEATAILEAACRSCEVDHCIKITGNVSEISENTPKVAHSLVHLNSTFPYETASARFASETALSTIIRIRKADCRRQMQSLLQSCAGNPVTAAFIFEAFAIEKLEKGGKFKCKELVAASVRTKPIPEDVEISPSTRQAVKKVAPDQEHDRLYVPEAKNYHGMDAWIHGKGAFQMTVGKKHAITSKAFDDIRILGNKFYWAVPPLHYEKFPKRGPPEIQEFALLIPYPTGADVQDDPDSICVSDQKEADIQEDVDMMCVSDSTEADKQVQEDPGIMSSV